MERYSRQIRFAPIGAEGQRLLGQSKVLIAGIGSLGASLAQHMARAGVGELDWSTAIMWSPAICSGKCCSMKRTPVSVSPRPLRQPPSWGGSTARSRWKPM